MCDLFVQTEYDAVLNRVFGERHRQFKRVNDSCGRRGEGALDISGQIRFAPENLIAAEYLNRNTVHPAAFGQLFDKRDLLLIDRQSEGTDHFQIDIEQPACFGENPVSGNVHFCFQASRGRIVAGMDDCRVCRRGYRADIAFPFQKEDAEPKTGQRAGGRGTDYACADNHNIESVRGVLFRFIHNRTILTGLEMKSTSAPKWRADRYTRERRGCLF